MARYSHKWTGMFDELERTENALNRSIRRKKRKKRHADVAGKPGPAASKAPRRLSASSLLWKHRLHDPAWSKTRWGYVVVFALSGFCIGAFAYDLAVRPYAHLFRYWTMGQLLTALTVGAVGAFLGWIVGKRKRYSFQSQIDEDKTR